MQTRMSWGVVGAMVAALTLGAAGCKSESRGEARNDAHSAVEQAQNKADSALDKAKEAQSQAQNEQQDATQAQKDLESQRTELEEAQARVQKEAQEAQRAQRQAQQQAQGAQGELTAAQQTALQEQQRAQQETAQDQQQSAQGQQRAAAPSMVSGRVEQADGSQLTVRGDDQQVHNLVLSSQTQVTVDGRAARAEDIQKGAQVRASLQDQGGMLQATRIDVSSASANSAVGGAGSAGQSDVEQRAPASETAAPEPQPEKR